MSASDACHDTEHLPVVHAFLICMAACDQQVGSWQAPTLRAQVLAVRASIRNAICFAHPDLHGSEGPCCDKAVAQ